MKVSIHLNICNVFVFTERKKRQYSPGKQKSQVIFMFTVARSVF